MELNTLNQQNKDLKIAQELFETAMNDWPEHISSPQDFLSELKGKLNIEVLNKTSIDNALKKFSPLSEAWIFEACSSLSEIFELYPGQNLDVIVNSFR